LAVAGGVGGGSTAALNGAAPEDEPDDEPEGEPEAAGAVGDVAGAGLDDPPEPPFSPLPPVTGSVLVVVDDARVLGEVRVTAALTSASPSPPFDPAATTKPAPIASEPSTIAPAMIIERRSSRRGVSST
jgi:hypothetical protein